MMAEIGYGRAQRAETDVYLLRLNVSVPVDSANIFLFLRSVTQSQPLLMKRRIKSLKVSRYTTAASSAIFDKLTSHFIFFSGNSSSYWRNMAMKYSTPSCCLRESIWTSFERLQDLSYKEKHWHEQCFLCAKCRVSLVDKPFGSKAEKVYCAGCYDAAFASRCDGCTEVFRAGELLGGHVYSTEIDQLHKYTFY